MGLKSIATIATLASKAIPKSLQSLHKHFHIRLVGRIGCISGPNDRIVFMKFVSMYTIAKRNSLSSAHAE